TPARKDLRVTIYKHPARKKARENLAEVEEAQGHAPRLAASADLPVRFRPESLGPQAEHLPPRPRQQEHRDPGGVPGQDPVAPRRPPGQPDARRALGGAGDVLL